MLHVTKRTGKTKRSKETNKTNKLHETAENHEGKRGRKGEERGRERQKRKEEREELSSPSPIKGSVLALDAEPPDWLRLSRPYDATEEAELMRRKSYPACAHMACLLLTPARYQRHLVMANAWECVGGAPQPDIRATL